MQEISTIKHDSFLATIKTNRFLIFSIVASGVLHLFFVLSADFTEQQCLNCEADKVVINVSLLPEMVILEKKLPEMVIQNNKPDKKSSEKAIATKQNPSPPQKISKIEQPTDNQQQPKKVLPKTLDYKKLNNSISSFLLDDEKQSQIQWDIQCENNKNEQNSLDCISDEERFGLKSDDQFGLAIAFSSLKGTATTKQKDKLYTELIAKETAVIAMLEIETIDPITRAMLSDQKNFLTKELHFQDCGSNSNVGNCAGEVDLLKLASLLTSILSK